MTPARTYYFLTIFLCCIFALGVSSVLAATDPISHTPDVTATVPSTTVSVTDTTAPTVPILIAPHDGAVTADTTPEFVWQHSTDPNGNTVTYTVYINNVATYLGVSDSGNSSGVGYTARVDNNNIYLIPSTGFAEGNYSWKVIATDPSGNQSSSTTWNFVIDTTPPYILLTDLDTHHDLALDSREPSSVPDGLNFTVTGPKDIYFTVYTEPWSTLTLKILTLDNEVISTSAWYVTQTGVIYPYQHLAPGTYQIQFSAHDHSNLTSALPPFTLTVIQAQISVPIPDIPGLPPEIAIPYTPVSIPSYPATIARITTSPYIAVIIPLLLALSGIILLWLLWKKRYNLVLIDTATQKPYRSMIVYHSRPDHRSLRTHLYLTRHEPICYVLRSSHRGRLYLRRLGRYSTLTLRNGDVTIVLSLSVTRRVYTLTV